MSIPQSGIARGLTPAKTPIKHLIVIFQENVSFDDYFATYPKTINQNNELTFQTKASTPE